MQNLAEMIFGRKRDPVSLAIEEAISMMETGDFTAAIDTLRTKALAKEPEHRRARLHLGVSLMLGGELDAAEAEFLHLLPPDRRWSDSESATARIALDRIKALRSGKD
jgi:Flp pilus assembly protein TadD